MLNHSVHLCWYSLWPWPVLWNLFVVFERFTGRRKLPKQIFSDQGTTSIRAEREIRETLFLEKSPEFRKIKDYTGNLRISWSFSPLYCPHFGGISEAAVKSFNCHCKRVLGETPLTFEEHSTLAAQIKACLNSRPLCAISPHDRESIPLTPGHFLVGRPLKTLPTASNLSDLSRSFQDRYMSLLAMRNSSWGKWKKEVLHHIAQSKSDIFRRETLRSVTSFSWLMNSLRPPAGPWQE